jgi:hypothetical protein
VECVRPKGKPCLTVETINTAEVVLVTKPGLERGVVSKAFRSVFSGVGASSIWERGDKESRQDLEPPEIQFGPFYEVINQF